MCLASGTGANLDVPADAPTAAGWLFGEDQGRYLLAVPRDAAPGILRAAAAAGVIARACGATGGGALTLRGDVPISMGELRSAHEGWLPALMAGAPGA
jgi:phosphoribosylformylglycinamidine synthase